MISKIFFLLSLVCSQLSQRLEPTFHRFRYTGKRLTLLEGRKDSSGDYIDGEWVSNSNHKPEEVSKD